MEDKNEILYHVAEEIFEKLAFIFSFPEDTEASIDDDAMLAAGVSFDGAPFSGELIMTMSNEALPELAGNMLGLDGETPTSDQQYDALKELINVLCGNLLPAVAGKDAIFNVAAPRIIDIKDIRQDERKPASYIRMALDDGPCEIFLFVDGN